MYKLMYIRSFFAAHLLVCIAVVALPRLLLRVTPLAVSSNGRLPSPTPLASSPIFKLLLLSHVSPSLFLSSTPTFFLRFFKERRSSTLSWSCQGGQPFSDSDEVDNEKNGARLRIHLGYCPHELTKTCRHDLSTMRLGTIAQAGT